MPKQNDPRPPVRVVRLLSENVKRLNAVDITPNPETNVLKVGGKNANGKTSLLDSIEMALAGGKKLPPQPVHRGKQTARVVVDLGELVIKRTFNAEGTTNLVVTTREGYTVPSPQKILDELASKLTFDPLGFTRLQPKQQADILRELCGLNFTPWEAEYKEAYDRRRDVNRDGLALKARSEGLGVSEADAKSAGSTESVDELSAELRRIGEENAKIDRLIDGLSLKRSKLLDLERDKKRARSEKEDHEAKIKRLNTEIVEIVNQEEALVEEIAGIEKNVPAKTDPSPIEAKLRDAAQVSQKIAKVQQWREIEKERITLRKEWEGLEEKVKGLENKKLDMIAKAEYPVEGLLWTEDGVLYKDLPFEQASGAEQLRVTVAMGAAMNPRLKIALIRDGSLLDDDSMLLLAELAHEYGLQVWIERVGDGNTCEHCEGTGKDLATVGEECGYCDGKGMTNRASLVLSEGSIQRANPDEVTVNAHQPKLEVK